MWLTIAQVCERVPLSRDSIYRAIRRGELPASERCNRLLVAEDELSAWLAAGRVTPGRREPLPTQPLRIQRGRRGTARLVEDDAA